MIAALIDREDIPETVYCSNCMDAVAPPYLMILSALVVFPLILTFLVLLFYRFHLNWKKGLLAYLLFSLVGVLFLVLEAITPYGLW